MVGEFGLLAVIVQFCTSCAIVVVCTEVLEIDRKVLDDAVVVLFTKAMVVGVEMLALGKEAVLLELVDEVLTVLAAVELSM